MTRFIRFECDGYEACMIDADTEEELWRLEDISDKEVVVERLYDLMTLATGEKRVSRIKFPSIGALTNES